MDREIWFDKVLWSYMPCHWKGWAVIVAIGLPTIIAILVGKSLLSAIGHSDAEWVLWLLFFLPAFISLMAIAKRHSR